MDDKFIRKAIRKKFSSYRQYVVLEEVCVTTGFDNYGVPRRIDMIVCDCFECNNFAIEGIEIKISKNDLMRELKDPEKHEVFFGNIDFYSIAAPTDLLKENKALIPEEWGLLGIDEQGSAKYIRKPKPVTSEFWYEKQRTVRKGFFASCMRNAMKQINSLEDQINDKIETESKEISNETYFI